jgi:hypothetical protein
MNKKLTNTSSNFTQVMMNEEETEVILETKEDIRELVHKMLSNL